ncbi:hypothetical protein L596_027155 [Steinernema carpocapsae]|uniref:Uncharacterized protein n=1 Tax=Steinernema carpocapsae TaxID=34508 RepID=A0A4U5M3H5_STECR|nr:hypothetical protein L596_027155 [Steinernema carpocapsae]
MELLRQELEIDEEGLSEADKILEECQREHEKFSYASEMPSTSFSPTPRPRMVHKCHTCQETSPRANLCFATCNASIPATSPKRRNLATTTTVPSRRTSAKAAERDS